MLGNKDAVANIAVRNLQTARKFYEGTLGLKAVGTEGDELIAFPSGGSTLYVYRSDFAGTNKAAAVTWKSATRWTPSCASSGRRASRSSATRCPA